MKLTSTIALSATCALGLALTACNKPAAPAAAPAAPAPAAPAAAAPAAAAPAAAPVAPAAPAVAAAPAAPAAAAPAGAPALDLSNPASSALTTKAWQANEAKNLDLAIAYANKVIELYNQQALDMQAATKAVPDTKEGKFALWALNDVGTCYFIKGQALENQGKKDEAVASYKFLAEKLPMAQCWDTKGWFWSPANAAREKLQKLQFDAM